MVNWNYKHKIGSFVTNEGSKYYIYAGNCLAVYGFEFNETDEKTGKNKRMFYFRGYWLDAKHLSNCLGLSCKDNDLYEGSYNWRINAYYKDAYVIIRRLVKAGHKVTVYYKK